mmetsp:Transcript_47498/g.146291  ORF Transcript_47498/g.146291 Transcript_47498/m.146291 type:complete len:302 (-) Transcript_47498:429-1334(-)
MVHGRGLQPRAAPRRAGCGFLLPCAVRATGGAGGAGAGLHAGVRNDCGDHLHFHAVLRRVQLHCFQEEQPERRPEPVLRPGRRLRRGVRRLRRWLRLRRLREPRRRHRPRRLGRGPGYWPRVDLGLRRASGRPACRGPLPAAPARGPAARGRAAGPARGRPGDQVPLRAAGVLHARLHRGHEPHLGVAGPCVVGGGGADMHGLLRGQRVGRTLQSRGHAGGHPRRPQQVLGARGLGLRLRAARGRHPRGPRLCLLPREGVAQELDLRAAAWHRLWAAVGQRGRDVLHVRLGLRRALFRGHC